MRLRPGLGPRHLESAGELDLGKEKSGGKDDEEKVGEMVREKGRKGSGGREWARRDGKVKPPEQMALDERIRLIVSLYGEFKSAVGIIGKTKTN